MIERNSDITPLGENYFLQPQKINGNLLEYFTSHQQFMNDLMGKVWIEFEEKLKSYLKVILNQFGYSFRSDIEFLNFCKQRIHRIAFEDKPNYFEFYLDYVNEENPGKCIGSYSDNIEFINEGNKITAVIGKNLG